MLNIQKTLNRYSLNPGNCIVVGSGILNALKLKISKDIDITVKQETYNKLLKLSEFKVEKMYGLEILKSGNLEIGTSLNLAPSNYSYEFDELFQNSIILDNVRYLTLEFLLKIKKEWNRDKDRKDIEIIEKYLQSH